LKPDLKDRPGLLLCYLIRLRSKPVYVGIVIGERQTVNRRFEQHCRRVVHGKRLYAAIQKEERENFSVEVIGRARSRSAIVALEIRMIARWRTYWKNGGLNGSRGGWPDSDDPEYRRKNATHMRMLQRKLATDPVLRKKQSVGHAAAMRKLHADPEYRRKNAAANRKLATDPVWRKNVAAANRKRWTDPKFRRARSEFLDSDRDS